MSKYTKKTKVSKTEYLQIMGLLVLGKQHHDAVNAIERALAALTGDESEWGHCGDAIFGDYSAKELLGKLDIKIPAGF